MASKQGGSGSRKHGRNTVKCNRYKIENRREKNKARKKAKYEKKRERARRNKVNRKEKSEEIFV